MTIKKRKLPWFDPFEGPVSPLLRGGRLGLATLGVSWLCSVLLAAGPDSKNRNEPALTDADRTHWAFRGPALPRIPPVRALDRVETPIDAFILHRLETAGLTFAPPGDRSILLRRLTLDLTGFPPTPSECASFIDDPRPDAYERVVERLLASPRHGEHWAQHWLDLVRYAESNGYEIDAERPHAWRYRDYVIRALNRDKPYDRFIVEQLAGDELADSLGRSTDPSRAAELRIASGFNRCGPIHLVSGNTDPEVNRQEVLTEMTSSIGSVFLGMTVGCARCHNHKFDPISQADYYRLQAFFAAAQPLDADISAAAERAAHQRAVAAIKAQIAPVSQEVAAVDAPYRKQLTQAKTAHLDPKYRAALAVPSHKRTAGERKLASDAAALTKLTWDEVLAALTPVDRARRLALRARIHELEARMPPPPAHAWGLKNEATAPNTYVLLRGDPKRKGTQVWPAVPRVLRRKGKGSAPASPRLELARWLTRPGHPLTARVMVNRLWQRHFGRGLVATPNDFGLRGEPPTHPDLLDWLARDFVASGWSIKHMHRLMVLSSVYRQAGKLAGGSARKIDPDNHLLWHMPRQRLQAEALRDVALAVAGTLNGKMGGPMVRVPLEPEVYELIFTEGEPDGLWLAHPDRREHARRSIYLFAKRNVRLPLLEAFDRPDSLTSCPVRPVSTFAPQALILMNGPFMQEQSKRLASRLLRECGPAADRQIDLAYRLALARPPRDVERKMGKQFLTDQAALIRERHRGGQPTSPHRARQGDPAKKAALADFCLALLNCNEFLYVK
jgi:hypothetical protein